MAKHTYPAPELRSILSAIDDVVNSPLLVRLVVRPDATPGRAYAAVELVYVHKNGTESVVRREGEGFATARIESLQGAWYRAALRLNQWCEGKDQDEVIRLHVWNRDLPR